MSGSLLVFAFFMLTDPRSIPNAKSSRIIWAICIALLSFILKEAFYLNTAVFWALFMISPLTTILDLIWQETRFRWQNKQNLELRQSTKQSQIMKSTWSTSGCSSSIER